MTVALSPHTLVQYNAVEDGDAGPRGSGGLFRHADRAASISTEVGMGRRFLAPDRRRVGD